MRQPKIVPSFGYKILPLINLNDFMNMTMAQLLRDIPNVKECIDQLIATDLLDDIPVKRIKFCVRLYLNKIRHDILSGAYLQPPSVNHHDLLNRLARFIRDYHHPHLTAVVNGTGVIVHTNLGRSCLPSCSMESLAAIGQRYCNLEFDLKTGKRGSRYDHVNELLCELTGAEAAIVVNNNAAAVLIALETLAKDKEVVVSRGQLVEIGGSFRIPDIMLRSGARLVEVGTTNRTHLFDYQNAVTEKTALFLRVHCSNYRIIGFSSEVSNQELVQLGNKCGIPVMEDLGSGCLVDLSRFGLAKEPTVQEAVASGVDIVTFSGDKMLGGPQAGIIVGKKKYIEKVEKNPLNRALRIDKFTLAALESILRLYLDESKALQEIPTLSMLTTPENVVKQRAQAFLRLAENILERLCTLELVRVESRVGGGAMPEHGIASWAVAVQPKKIKVHQLECQLRLTPLPVIGRIEGNRLLLDMRTIADDELDRLFESLHKALALELDKQ